MRRACCLWRWSAVLTALGILGAGLPSQLVAQQHTAQRQTSVVKDWEDDCPIWRRDNPQRDFPSPDGKYVAHVEIAEEGGYLILYILPNEARIRREFAHNRRLSLVPGQVCVTSFAWVPGRKHTLVFATADMYGVGGIRYWNGGHVVRVLRGHAPKHRYEDFALYSEWTGEKGAERYYRDEHDDALRDYYIERVRRDGTVYYEVCISPSPRVNRWYQGKVKVP